MRGVQHEQKAIKDRSYDIAKICLELCFVIAFKVWDSTKNLQLALLAFISPILLYFIVKAIRSYYRRKALLESSIDVIDAMSGEEFEELLLAHYLNLGYTGKTTPKTGDYGADLVLEKDHQRIVVQAKRWKSVVGIEAVQQIIGAIKYYSAVKGMVVTNSVFTENAHELARANGIELIDRERLIEIMKKSQGKTYLTLPLKDGVLRRIKRSASFLRKIAQSVAGSWSREKENMVRLSDARGFLCVA